MEDKKMLILYGIIIVSVLGLTIGIFSLTFGHSDSNVESEKTTRRVGTTARRTTTSKKSMTTTIEEPTITTTITNNVIEPITSSITSTVTTTKKITTTKKVTTTKTTTTTKKTTKKTTTTAVTTTKPAERETTESDTTYPLAQNDIEWAIFDMINEERLSKGYQFVKMSVDFRRLAEEAADYQYDFPDEEIKKYLYGLNNYRRVSNHLYTTNQAILSLYTASVQNTPVLEDPDIRYVGIGVIFREIGLGDRPTYYYVIIYE